MREVVVAGAVRTPIGKFGGALASLIVLPVLLKQDFLAGLRVLPAFRMFDAWR